jgi:streptomycin 6-kinase
MIEDAGRFRFGDEYVDSGSHRVHSRIAQSCFTDAVIGNAGGWLITHPERNLGESGFALNRFKANPEPYDVHANAEFYKDAMEILFAAV